MALHLHLSINQILMTEQKMDDLKQLMRDESNFEEIVLGAYRPICIIAKLIFSPLYATVFCVVEEL